MDAVERITDDVPPWQDILVTARELIGADSGSLVMVDGLGNPLDINQVDAPAAAMQEYQTRFHKLDFMVHAASNFPVGTWFDSNEIVPKAALHRTEYYADFLHKHRFAQVFALVLERGPKRMIGLSFQRSSIVEGVTKHLSDGAAGAYIHSFRAAVERRRQATAHHLDLIEATFGAMGEATFLLSNSGIVVHAAALAKSLLDDSRGLCIKQGKLWHPSTAVLDRLSMNVAATLRTGRRSTMTVSRSWGETLRLDMTVADPRIRLSNETMVFVRMRRNSALNEASAENLVTTFDITQAEAKVLVALVAGLVPSELAVQNGVSENTVRTQIASLKRKMHCNRIVDLVRLALQAQT
ncbi:helix-turn-helix transcriptional regulator [Burkholderia sp. JKS000303]|uniref:helix-turn-helix transcriptional regulator n=1 Tax=Burkholderia sp. JKS000303 TaxID=1938747 RepID=UPI000C009709|nr:helix-turn-helix transcriptional regulator [Burkholderia sp. JKS000303]PFH19333.1 DNA-binding CsgD family transcriptional regulator [Burkholderia sp. JKS000303]